MRRALTIRLSTTMWLLRVPLTSSCRFVRFIPSRGLHKVRDAVEGNCLITHLSLKVLRHSLPDHFPCACFVVMLHFSCWDVNRSKRFNIAMKGTTKGKSTVKHKRDYQKETRNTVRSTYGSRLIWNMSVRLNWTGLNWFETQHVESFGIICPNVRFAIKAELNIHRNQEIHLFYS